MCCLFYDLLQPEHMHKEKELILRQSWVQSLIDVYCMRITPRCAQSLVKLAVLVLSSLLTYQIYHKNLILRERMYHSCLIL